jgi:dimethylargininase
MPTAWLREVPDSYVSAIISGDGRAPDVDKARAQHDRYQVLLGAAGYELVVLPADEAHPDCVFIEDTAVVLGPVAVITRPGAESRRGEVGPVAEALAGRFELAPIVEPATLDGGDVMLLGDRVFVGRSTRSNDEGISQLSAIADRQGLTVVPVPVRGALHLKSAVLPVGHETVVVTPGTVDEGLLSGVRIVHEARRELHAFSALPLATGDVLVTMSAPETARKLVDLGVSVIPIDVSEIQATDGGLTCMSILTD